MNKPSRIVAAAIAATFASGAALAAPTADFDVTITIVDSCDVDITPPTDLDFGSHGVLSAAITQQSTISVTCTEGAQYDLALNAGLNGAGVTTARRMLNGANDVTYDLYQDSGYTLHWGEDGGTDTVAGTGTGDSQTHTVYGRVPAQTTPPAGEYVDTVTVTVTY